jgi:hypothetical protein
MWCWRGAQALEKVLKAPCVEYHGAIKQRTEEATAGISLIVKDQAVTEEEKYGEEQVASGLAYEASFCAASSQARETHAAAHWAPPGVGGVSYPSSPAGGQHRQRQPQPGDSQDHGEARRPFDTYVPRN